MPNFKFCGGREHTTTTFVFFSWTLIKIFRIQIQKKIADIWRIERDGISAIKFEAARHYFLSDVFCLSSLVSVLKNLACELAHKWRGPKRKSASGAWLRRGKKEGGGGGVGGCRLCFDDAHLWYQSLVSWADWLHFPFREKYPIGRKCYWSRCRRKKHHNLTGVITILTCYWHMCYRIIASGRCAGQHQNKGYELPLLLFSPRPSSAYCTRQFSFFAPDPLGSLFAGYQKPLPTV